MHSLVFAVAIDPLVNEKNLRERREYLEKQVIVVCDSLIVFCYAFNPFGLLSNFGYLYVLLNYFFMDGSCSNFHVAINLILLLLLLSLFYDFYSS